MTDKKINICVVGGGKWGMNHIKTLNQLSALGGVVDSDNTIRENVKQNFKDSKVFSSLNEALTENFDGFIVATPAKTHYKLAKKIIENEKSVLVEKPLTLDLQTAKSLNELAIKYKVNLMVGHVLLFHPAFQKMKSIIDDGYLGKIQYIYSNRLNLGTFRTDENVFWSFAPHDISLLNYFFEDKPINVTSRGLDILQKDIHDTTITTFDYKNNRMGHIFVSWLHPFKEHRFVIVGSNGMLHFEDSKEGKPLILYDKKAVFSGSVPNPKSGEITKIAYDNSAPLKNELRYFISKIKSGSINIANGESAVDVIDLLEKSSISLKENDLGRS